jgi:putative ubiquitin-RnfH superfamily antitoxin RatB of RatAB toxin-antitoxin module
MAPSTPDCLRIQVVYAPPPEVPGAATAPAGGASVAAVRPWTVTLDLPRGATVRDAVLASGLLEHFPGMAMEALDLGVFNRACSPNRGLEHGDRVEIYRPLQIDPKAARHLRVEARRKADARARQLARTAAGGAPTPRKGDDAAG